MNDFDRTADIERLRKEITKRNQQQSKLEDQQAGFGMGGDLKKAKKLAQSVDNPIHTQQIEESKAKMDNKLPLQFARAVSNFEVSRATQAREEHRARGFSNYKA